LRPELYQPVLDWWKNRPQDSPLLSYTPGGDGPVQADELLTADGRRWM